MRAEQDISSTQICSPVQVKLEISLSHSKTTGAGVCVDVQSVARTAEDIIFSTIKIER